MAATGEIAGSALAAERRLWERFQRAFFRSFFRLLLLFIGAAEWASFAWVLYRLGIRPPLAVHLVAPLAVLALNRWIVGRRGSRPLRPLAARLLRGYAAVAFTCVFCGLFLAAAGIGWSAIAAASLVAGGPSLETVGHVYGHVVDAGLATVAGLMLFGYTLGSRRLDVSRHRMAVPGLPAALQGFRIVHLTDLHIGAYLDLDELAVHVGRVNALEPDLVCITGDLVDRRETCAAAFPVLAGLRARHGVVVTLGNHDFYAGADRVTAALRHLTPFTVLRNERMDLEVAGAILTVLGVDDLGRDWARGVPEHPAIPSLASSLADDAAVLLLSHRPDCFAQAARLGVSVMLSGHTHGGQLALPSWFGKKPRNLAEFISRFDRGLYRRGRSTLYVNRGLGFTGQRIRLFTPREVACIELHCDAERPDQEEVHGHS